MVSTEIPKTKEEWENIEGDFKKDLKGVEIIFEKQPPGEMTMIDIQNTPRPWGGGNHLSQTDMDDLEVRKVRALERIADALDGGKTSKYSGITIKGSFISPMQQHIGSMLLHFPWKQFYYTKSLPQYMSF